MKNIPFRRKLKHIVKNKQRNNALKIPETGDDLKDYFLEMNVFMSNSDASYLLKTSHKKTARFYKLCKRLGNAAKKQEKIIDGRLLWNIVEWGYFLNESGKRVSDPREMPFFKFFRVDVVQTHSVFVLDNDVESVLEHRKDFNGSIYFKRWDKQTQKVNSFQVHDLTLEVVNRQNNQKPVDS